MKFRLRWTSLLPFHRKPKLLPPAETAVAKAEEQPLSTISAEFEPYVPVDRALDAQPEPLAVEAQSEPAVVAVPPNTIATIPRTLPPPYPDEWMRARAMYFAPATYSPSPGIDRVLAPDLLYRLGADTRRAIPEPRTEPPPAPTPPARSPRLASWTTSPLQPKLSRRQMPRVA